MSLEGQRDLSIIDIPECFESASLITSLSDTDAVEPAKWDPIYLSAQEFFNRG